MFEDEFLNRIAKGYGVLLVSVWVLSLTDGPGIPAFQAFMLNLRWLLTMPLIALAVVGVIVLIFSAKQSEKQPTNQPVMNPLPILKIEPPPVEVRIPPAFDPEPPKKETPNQRSAKEKREAEEHLERTRFHQVKQMRSSKEALEASLDEF